MSNTGIVWTLQEIRILQGALTTAEEPPDVEALAKQLGRNPAQVRAFLRNQNTKTRIAADLALETANNGNNNSSTIKNNTAANNNMGQITAGGTAGDVTTGGSADTPRRRGGRGPKPPTTAIHTVPNAECNASLLLLGGFLPPEEDPDAIVEAKRDSSPVNTKKPSTSATRKSSDKPTIRANSKTATANIKSKPPKAEGKQTSSQSVDTMSHSNSPTSDEDNEDLSGKIVKV